MILSDISTLYRRTIPGDEGVTSSGKMVAHLSVQPKGARTSKKLYQITVDGAPEIVWQI